VKQATFRVNTACGPHPCDCDEVLLTAAQRGVNGVRAAAPRPRQGVLETLCPLLSTLESYRKRLALP